MSVFTSNRTQLWPSCTMPFVISDDFPAGSANRQTIQDAIDHWNQRTVMNLVPRSSQSDFVVFRTANDWCSSNVGRIGGEQPIGCDVGDGFGFGAVVHEIGHAVGIWHEQTREDRDQFVTVHFDNIRRDVRFAFRQHITDGDDVGPYDYGSIMHYPSRAFAIDRTQDTITAPEPIGQSDRLSDGDVNGVSIVYTTRMSFRSVNYPDRHVRHQSSRIKLHQNDSTELFQKDATFKHVPALAGVGFSFESVNYPGRYLRHRGFELWLDENDGTDLFRMDASFIQRPGLFQAAGFTYESVNYPGRYVRHYGFELFLHADDGSSLFEKDATFVQEPGLT